MKRIYILLSMLALAVCCNPVNPDGGGNEGENQQQGGEKLANITYQLNVYSFADSDGDGWGDINGIAQHLDYLEGLGVTSLWLSPVQTSSSYHGYNVLDYNAIDPRLGTEADFRDLIDKAGEKGIDIYMDYVLNHSGRGEWFKAAISSESSPYRSYYVISDNPTADVAAGKVDNFAGATNPGMGNWYTASGGNIGYKGRLHFKLDWGKKTITVTESTAAAQPSCTSASKWLWIGSTGLVGLYPTGGDIHEITFDVDTDWGFLVRSSSTSWDNGTKWGGNGTSITFGQPYSINSSTAADITFGGTHTWFFASFDQSMPDLNYGPYDKASESPAFKAIAASADKWINMGVNGLRLDAVIWIYQNQAKANATFLKQWYDRCNATYKARGGEGDIYMVGEAWEETSKIASYYEGLPSLFNFSYWWTLKDRINKGKGDDFAKTVLWFRNQYRSYRADFIDAIKLSNHDEDRAASDLGKDVGKEKLAGAVLLTSPGKPFIYQGEELGYWGTKSGGDEYIRTPIKWTRNGTVPAKALGGKVDNAMLTAEISVESQSATESSILNVYRAFAKARNNYKALAHGEMKEVSTSSPAVGSWTMSYEDQTVLVVHNFKPATVSVSMNGYKLTDSIVSNGICTANGSTVTLSPYGSIVYLQ